jgi:Bacterial regulatory proteins, luxR family
MSVATVKAHVSHVLEKLEFNNRVQIARSPMTPARRNGWHTPLPAWGSRDHGARPSATTADARRTAG